MLHVLRPLSTLIILSWMSNAEVIKMMSPLLISDRDEIEERSPCSNFSFRAAHPTGMTLILPKPPPKHSITTVSSELPEDVP